MLTNSSLKLRRRITLSFFGVMSANLLFHSIGVYIFDFTQPLMSSSLAVSELLNLLSSTSNYSDQLPQFAEFVLILFGFMIVSALALTLLILRRLVHLAGLRKVGPLESGSFLLAIVFFFWIGLHPYVLHWPTGNENDKTLILSLYFQMSVQSALWAMTSAIAVACLLFPEELNLSKHNINKSG